VDDARAVRGRQRVGDLAPELEHLVERQRPLAQAMRERLAVEVLHDQERHRAGRRWSAFGRVVRLRRQRLAADVIQDADVRVVESGDGAGFLLEPAAPFAIRGGAGGQDLDRDVAAQPRIAGLVDLAHAAGADGG
jgi:hypothetical protein